MKGRERAILERRSSGRREGLVEKSETVRVRMLGGFSVSVGSRVVEGSSWRLKKAASLVKLLALAEGHRLHREQVMGLLTLHVARKTLEPTRGTASCHLQMQGEQIVLCPDGLLRVDVEAFEEAVATARRARDPAAYRAAVALYAGDLLPGDLYEEWTEERRGELRSTYLTLLVEMAGIHEQRGEFEAAVEVLEGAVASSLQTEV